MADEEGDEENSEMRIREKHKRSIWGEEQECRKKRRGEEMGGEGKQVGGPSGREKRK